MNFAAERINYILQSPAGKTYLEIGVFEGKTFQDVVADYKVAVDTSFRFDTEAFDKERCKFYQVTSDEYFLRYAKNDIFNLIFIDGLHSFEQTFRDFCCSLRHAISSTVWIIDDVYPCDIFSALPTQQDAIEFRKSHGGHSKEWHGDVYKIVFAIHDFFPTMSYATTNTNGNPQMVVWYEPRKNFSPAFNSLEKISRLSWFDVKKYYTRYINFMDDLSVKNKAIEASLASLK